MKEGKKEVKREGMRKGGKETARANKENYTQKRKDLPYILLDMKLYPEYANNF